MDPAPESETFLISLPAEMAHAVRDLVASGKYGSVDELVQGAMRCWLKREGRLESLDGAIARGTAQLDAGLGRDLEEVMPELIAKFQARQGSFPRPLCDGNGTAHVGRIGLASISSTKAS